MNTEFTGLHRRNGAYRLVEAAAAGPHALGILVPPGPRTVVLLRPRALDFDLLSVRTEDGRLAFVETEAAVAACHARELLLALEHGAASGRIELTPLANEAGCLVIVTLAGFRLLVCQRTPGQAYQPARFASVDTAAQLAALLEDVLCPAPGTVRDVYFNTRDFPQLARHPLPLVSQLPGS